LEINYTGPKNLISSIITLGLWVVLVWGCSDSGSGGASSGDAVERGKIKFVKTSYSRSFYVNGKKWWPADDQEFAKKINWCDLSPNAAVEVLRCFGDSTEDYGTTYILKMKGEEPVVNKLDEGTGSVWVNEDGRWLLYRKFFYNVETEEKIEVKGMPWADDPKSSAPVQYVLGISPDMKTVVRKYRDLPRKKGEDDFISLEIIDTQTGNSEIRKVNFTENQWLNDYQNPSKDIQPPPATSKQFGWEKGQDGKDKIILPKLLEKLEKIK
jgi:hypothetical protein